MSAATHPPAADLQGFALGRLDPEQFAAVEAHLADCPDCVTAAATAAGDTFTDLLRAATHTDAPADTPPAADAATLAWEPRPGPAPAAAPPGLAGHPRYRLVRPLGSGGMGSVWLAEHAVMGRPVALKVIRPEFLSRPGAGERFTREVRAAAKLHHPNIVTAFDAEEAGGMHFLVMEYVEGQTLADRLAAGPLPVAEACRAVRDAARGLAHAHAHGLTHRDVKPHNLILTADGTVKVLDFGLASVADGAISGLTGENVVVGTPDYIAPEQAEDARAADPRSDVYALGCTLYHLLAGRVPFPADTVLKKLDAHRTRTPEPIPGLPPGLAAVLAKMMAKRPADRYQSAAEVVAALEPFTTDPFRRDRRERSRRNRWWVAVAAGLLAATAGVTYQVVIIRDKDGKTVGQIEVPKGGSVEVKPEAVGRDAAEPVTVAPAPPQAVANPDQELILGTWEAVAINVEGRGGTVFGPTLTVTRDRVAWKADPESPLGRLWFEGAYHLDAAKSPKTIDVTLPGDVRRTVLGIYALDGDTLKLCVPLRFDRMADRPTKFAAEPGPERAVITLRRRPTEPPAQVRKSDHDLILGTWQGVAAEVAGQPMLREMIDAIRPTWTFTADTVNVRLQAAIPPSFLDLVAQKGVPPQGTALLENGFEGVYKLEPAKSPKAINVWPLKPVRRTGLGIYALDGDTLKLCLAFDPWDVIERPTEFATRPGTFRVLVTLKRAAPEPPGQVRKFGRLAGPVFQAAVSRDGAAVYAIDAGAVTKYRLATGERIWETHPGGVQVALPADNGFVLAWAHDGTVRALDPLRGAVLRQFDTDAGHLLHAALSPDGTRAVTGHGDPTDDKVPVAVRVWDVASGKEVFPLKGHAAATYGFAFSPDGTRIATASYDGTLRLWDARTGKELHAFTGQQGALSAVAFTPDGAKLVTCGQDTTVRVWDVAGKKLAATFPGHDVWSTLVAVTPDGARAVSAGWGEANGSDGLRVWDLASGKQSHHFPEVRGILYSIAFTPDSHFAVTAGDDGFVRVWRLPEPPVKP